MTGSIMRRFGSAIAALALVALAAGCANQAFKPAGSQVASIAKPNPPALTPEVAPETPPPVEIDWREHFSDISEGAILVRVDERRLSYWSPAAASYREFPIAVPRAAELERLGRTSVVRRRKNPDWRPTPDMLRRNPKLPAYVGPGPDNPLGPRALYLGWTYYAIHGTNNEESIGRATTSGCFRLFNEHITWLFDRVEVGTPVRVVRRAEPVSAVARASQPAVTAPAAGATVVSSVATTAN